MRVSWTEDDLEEPRCAGACAFYVLLCSFETTPVWLFCLGLSCRLVSVASGHPDCCPEQTVPAWSVAVLQWTMSVLFWPVWVDCLVLLELLPLMWCHCRSQLLVWGSPPWCRSGFGTRPSPPPNQTLLPWTAASYTSSRQNMPSGMRFPLHAAPSRWRISAARSGHT